MKNINKLLLLAMFAFAINLLLSACKDSFLEVKPTSALTEEVLSGKKGLDGLLIGCYGVLTGRAAGFYSGFGNWVHGSILGGEANKGTNGGDQAVVNPVQRYETLPNSGVVGEKWRICFEGVARCNTLLRLAGSTTDPTVTAADKTRLAAEARFLRGFYYFELRRAFGNVPYVDESMTSDEAIKVPNNVDIYPKIEADFQFAADNLPETQSALGRANKWAAKAFLAKVYLYQKKYTEGKTLFAEVIANGKTSGGAAYALVPNYADFFKAENDNNPESVFAAQTAVNTGDIANSNSEHVLNFPYNTGSDGPAGCCGFFQPSFDLANSFRTDANGLPLLDDSYNSASNEVKNDFGLKSGDAFTPDAGALDPRLDHSVGRRGVPYLDWIEHPGDNWIRDQAYAGPYSPKKFVFYKATLNTLTDGSSWTRGYTAINQPLMRFADVLLMAAECEIEAGSLETARSYVNQVRARSANPAGWVKRSDGSNAANYVIGLYNTPWTDKTAANTAVRFERKLELSGEGHRFYDLVRWGIAAPTLNAYLAFEGSRLSNALGGATFTAGVDELYPIPQSQIDIQGAGVLKQNNGY
ncbi:MAG: RagB/SusD family nutrient uptake outer membrane protein [Saprospiraceae bacterium]|nr:RagB/SusD family nutrient uptake outer membrane protein [Saprospiraceae bacterium]